METIFKKYPELFEITKYNSKNSIIYGKKFEIDFVESIAWIYKNYFNNTVLIFLPSIYIFESEYTLNYTLESLERSKFDKNTVVIFAYADIFFNNMCKINKRRLNTQLKNISKKCKCIILSKINLKVFDLNALDTFELNKLNNYTFDYSLIDLIDSDQDVFHENVENLVEFIKGKNKIYISLNMNIDKMVYIETELKKNGFTVSRKENDTSDIIINSARTTENIVLENTYNFYILILPLISEYADFLNYIKDIPETAEIYMDSTKEKNILNCLQANFNGNDDLKRNKIIDSEEYPSYNECLKAINTPEEPVLASDDYYLFEPSEQIQSMDLSNLSKMDYDIIRNFVKFKLNSKYELETKTCQLATPTSPKDRSRKLNSLSNKISSYNYRCEITCEIFKDYSIGVIIWNETFSMKNIKVDNNVYIYQTTSGKWKYTKVN